MSTFMSDQRSDNPQLYSSLSEIDQSSFNQTSRFAMSEMEFEVAADARYSLSTPITDFASATAYNDASDANEFPNINSLSYKLAKRVFDIVFASVALACTSPVLLIIAVAIKISSKGPVFF